MTKEIEQFNTSARSSIRALYEALMKKEKEERKAQTKLDNQDNSNLFNTFDKSEVLDPIELKYVTYFQDTYNSQIDKTMGHFTLLYDYYSYGILMYMRQNFPMRASSTNVKKYNIQNKNDKLDKNLIRWRLTLMDKNGKVLYTLIDMIVEHLKEAFAKPNEELELKSELTSNSLITLNGVDFEVDYIWLRVKDEEEGFYFGYARELYKHKELVLVSPLKEE